MTACCSGVAYGFNYRTRVCFSWLILSRATRSVLAELPGRTFSCDCVEFYASGSREKWGESETEIKVRKWLTWRKRGGEKDLNLQADVTEITVWISASLPRNWLAGPQRSGGHFGERGWRLPEHSLCVLRLIFRPSERRRSEPPSFRGIAVICVCCSRLEGRVAAWIMQQAGDEPSQEVGPAQTRQSMTCLGDDASHSTDTLKASLLSAEFLQLKTAEKSNRSPPGEISPTLTCAAATSALASSDSHLSHKTARPHFLPSATLWLPRLVSDLKS